MRRALCLLLAALLALVCSGAAAEKDIAVLEQSDALTEYLDDNGVDTVWRPVGQPFFGEADGAEVCGFLDIVELADTELLVLRLTVSMELDGNIAGEEVTFTLGKETWHFPAQRRTSEYDMVYQEDYSAVLFGDSLGLARALAGGKGSVLSFTVTGAREVSGTLTIPGEAAAEVWKLYRAAGGDKQDFSPLAEE